MKKVLVLGLALTLGLGASPAWGAKSLSGVIEVPPATNVVSGSPTCADGLSALTVLDVGPDVIAGWFGASGGVMPVSVATADGQASCAVICVEGGHFAPLQGVELSDGQGRPFHTYSAEQVFAGVSDVMTSDRSGWREIKAIRTRDYRSLVCAVATNWSADRPARKVITVRYRD